MKVELIEYTHNPVEVIEKAAATCYDSEPSADGKIMKQCIRAGHQSVAEHVMFTFKITDVSRALMAQLTRHRIGTAFSIRSQRYCDESAGEGFKYVTPGTILNSEQKDLYDAFMNYTVATYKLLVDAGIPKEDARYVLPNACATEITFSCNLRELIHLCHERMCTRAQEEIRAMTYMLADEVVKVMPEAKEFLVPKCEAHKDYPFCTEPKGCGRHKKLKDVYKAE